MLVRCVQRAYPFLRTERTHGLSSRICKHQFSDWTSLQVKGRFPSQHTLKQLVVLCGDLNVVYEMPVVVILRLISVISC